MKHKIALAGFGTVGQGLCEILADKKDSLKEKYDFEYDIVAVSDLVGGNVYNANGLNIPQMMAEAKEKGKFSQDTTPWDTLTLIKESNATIMCEMTYTDLETGEPASSHCRAALSSGRETRRAMGMSDARRSSRAA